MVTRLNHAIITMKNGEMVVFTLPPDLGYGATGKNGVPPNCVIQFEVDLISWITIIDVCKNDGIIKKVMDYKSLAPLGEGKVMYFTLADLWNSFDEWRNYGAGVQIRVDNEETLIQYYMPYLSIIQMFTSNSSNSLRHEETESVCETRDSFSDSFSDELEGEKLSR
ncbi:unnamed protein product [Camellia sinensis]